MNLVTFFDEVWTVLGAVDGLNVPSDGPGVRTVPPAPYLELPAVTYGEYGPGLDRIPDLGLTVVFGPAGNAEVFGAALAAASTSGAASIPAALRAHTWTSVHTLRVGMAEPETVTDRGGNPAVAYTFHLDISGAP